MTIRVENSSQCCNQGSAEAARNMIGAAIFSFNVEVTIFQICRPLVMVIVLQLPLCLYKLKRWVIGVDNILLPQNVMIPLSISMHDGIHLFIIGRVLLNCIGKFLTMIGHQMSVLGENCTNSIVSGICLDFKWFLQVWQCEYWCRVVLVLQFSKCLLLGPRLGKLFFRPAFSNLT